MKPEEMKADRFFLVAKRNGKIRAAMVVEDLTCEEVAETLLEWHETDPERRLEIVTSLKEED